MNVDGVFVNTYEDDLLHFVMNDYLSIGLTLNLHNENINIYNLGNLYQNKYYCLGTFDKNIDSYKFNNKLISLDKSVNIDINDKNISKYSNNKKIVNIRLTYLSGQEQSDMKEAPFMIESVYFN